MYEQFYGFKKKPFQLLPNPDFLFRSKKHDIALTHLEYGIYDRAGFIVVTGEIGTGKTTLLNYLLRTLKSDLPIAFLSQTCLNPDEFLRVICQEFSLPHEGKSKSELMELFGSFLVEQYQKGRYVILILDEAQNLPLETLEEIRMLSNLDAGSEALLQIILVGQPGLRDKLRWEGLRQLTQRIEVSYHLGPLDHDETKDYIRYRIEKADGPDPDLFDDSAVEEIFTYSQGIPRLINAVCHMCLVYGMADEVRRVDSSLVVNVLRDRTNWDLIPAENGATEKDIHQGPQGFADTVKIEGILRNLESKLGLFVEIAAGSKMALDEIVARLPEGGNHREGAALSEESVEARKLWKAVLYRLVRIEETLGSGVENQKRLLGLFTPQRVRAKRSPLGSWIQKKLGL
jgi:general secretion pathway protein A